MRLFIKKAKVKIQQIFNEIYYVFKYKKQVKIYPHVVGDIKTIDQILKKNYSVSRFGDGEMNWILNEKTNSFEKNSTKLSRELIKVLNSKSEGHINCIPDIKSSIDKRNFQSRLFWKSHIGKYAKYWKKYTNDQTYYDTNFTRPYIGFKKKDFGIIDEKFNKIKQIWDKKNVLIIEGKYTRLGLNNDLLENTLSIHRIICPEKNAFEKFDEIFQTSLKILNSLPKDTLVICSLGPTATILTYRLYKSGYRSIDIGHIDIEYTWFLNHDNKKVLIPGKYVNEAGGIKKDIKLPAYYTNSILEVINE